MIQVYKLGAEWCRPCRAMAPAMATLAEKYNVEGSLIEIIDVDIDVDNALAVEHGVRTIPMTLFMVNEELALKKGGVLTADAIMTIIYELGDN